MTHEKRNIRSKSGYRYRLPRFLNRANDEDVASPHILWRGLVDNTTVHGVPSLGKSRGELYKINLVSYST